MAWRRLLLWAVLGGCTTQPADPDVDFDGTTSDGSGSVTASASGSATASETGSTGAPGGCAADERCLAVPAGFAGPVALTLRNSNEAPPLCAGTFSEELAELGADFEAGSLGCLCQCGAPKDAACEDPVLQGFDEADNTCSGMPQEEWTVTADCEALIFEPGLHYQMADSAWLATCEATAVEQSTPPVFGSTLRACKSVPGDPCDGGTCTPPAPDGFPERLCIHADGEVDCPPAFPDQLIAHAGIDDQRACDSADCSCTVTGSCNWFGTMHAGACDNPVLAINNCSAQLVVDATHLERTEALSDDPDCEPVETTVMATGNVATTGTTTFCCEF